MSLAVPFTIVGSATLLSRLTGFVRDVLIAAVLGTGPVADVYVAAFLLPNLFRKMMSEGALNAAIVPRLARLEREGGQQAARGYFDDLLSLALVVVIVLVLVAEFAMPQIMAIMAHGFAQDEAKFADAVLFGRIAFPFVGFGLLLALLSALLNAVERYTMAALVPVVLNLLMIAVLGALITLVPVEKRQAGLILVATILIGGIIQLALLWFAAGRAGFAVAPRPWDALSGRIDPSARALLLLVLPGMVVAGSGHVQMIVASQFASFEPRAISWLYFADRLFQLPLGFVAAAVGVVLLPRIARAIQRDDSDGIAEAQSESLVFAALLILPASIALHVLAGPIVATLFQRGAFNAEDAAATAAILEVLALALPGFVMVKIILPAFLARERMHVPLAALFIALGCNIGAVLFLRAEAPRLAPAYGVAAGAWANALLLAAMVGGRFELRLGALRRLLACLVAALAMGAGIAALARFAAPWLDPARPLAVKGAVLGGICLAGLALYLGLARALGAWRLGDFRRA